MNRVMALVSGDALARRPEESSFAGSASPFRTGTSCTLRAACSDSACVSVGLCFFVLSFSFFSVSAVPASAFSVLSAGAFLSPDETPAFSAGAGASPIILPQAPAATITEIKTAAMVITFLRSINISFCRHTQNRQSF